MNFTNPAKPQITINDLNKCVTCQCNKICDHNKFGYENCDNYIPGWISTRIALPEENKYVLLMRKDITIGAEVVYFNSKKNLDYWTRLDGFWMPIPNVDFII